MPANRAQGILSTWRIVGHTGLAFVCLIFIGSAVCQDGGDRLTALAWHTRRQSLCGGRVSASPSVAISMLQGGVPRRRPGKVKVRVPEKSLSALVLFGADLVPTLGFEPRTY
jgi:hypothetical protein